MTSVNCKSKMPKLEASTTKNGNIESPSSRSSSKQASRSTDEDIPPTQPVTVKRKSSTDDKTGIVEKNGKLPIKQEISADGSDEEFIDIRPNLRVKKSHLTSETIESLIVKCTACRNQINHHDSHRVKRHPHLGVLICKECLEFYDTGEFSQDDDGDKYCRWCAQGGTLFSCDFCSNVFCNECVRYNFGRGEARKISEQKWKCYVCEPQPLEGKIKFCDILYEYSKGRALKKKTTKTFKHSPVMENYDGGDGLSPVKFLPKFFSKSMEIANEFKAHVGKLNKKLDSNAKTPKQLLKKFEQLIGVLRSNSKEILIELNETYNSYIKDKTSKAASDSSMLATAFDDNDETVQTESDTKFDTSIPDTVNSLVDNIEANEFAERSLDDELAPAVPCDKLNSTQPLEILDKKMALLNDKVPVKDGSFFIKENFVFSGSDTKSGGSSLKDDPSTSKVILGKSSLANKKNCKDSKQDEMVIDLITSGSECSDATVKRSDSDLDEKPSKVNIKKEKKLDSKSGTEILKSQKISDEKKLSKVKSSKSSLSSSLSSSANSFSDHDVDRKVEKSKKKMKKKSLIFTKEELAEWNSDKATKLQDVKLQSIAAVVLYRLDISSSEIEAVINSMPKKSEKSSLKSMERSVDRLLKESMKRKLSLSSNDDGPKPACKKSTKNKKKKDEKANDSSSDAISLASFSDSNSSKKNTEKSTTSTSTAKNKFAKVFHNSESDDDSSGRDMDVLNEKPQPKTAKTTKKKAKDTDSENSVISIKSCNDDSDDDFVGFRKISKKDEKLIKKANCAISNEKDDETSEDDDKSEKGKSKSKEKKKTKKRKIIYSEDSGSSSQSTDSESASDSMSDFESKKKKKKGASNKRKRIKIDNSSDENDAKKDEEEDPQSQTTPGKGRKNIRKVISEKSLEQETIEAQATEKERRQRLQDRQKLYNRITDTAEDGKEVITRKMVLEIDPDSKEEVLQIHPDLIEKLKPHQVNGVKFMWEATIESLKLLEIKPGSGCILAHCMGLGKTLQVITFLYTLMTNKIAKKKIKTAMIICPNNTVMNWAKEFEYWLEDGTETINIFEMIMIKDYHSRLECLKNWQKDGGVLIIGYDIFARLVDGKMPKKNKEFKNKIFAKIANPGADIVVCDEGHKLKNEKSLLSRCANKLRTQRRIVLTGTPLQNNLKEYYCMMNFVKPRLLGTFKEFTNRFVNPITNGQYDDSSRHDVKLMKKRVHILHKLLEGCVQRCDYSALTHFLPPKHEFVISVKLSDVQIKLYQSYLDQNLRVVNNEDGEQKVDGRKLFPDYSILKNVWTFPYALQLNYQRIEKRRFLKGDDDVDEEGNLQDFIDDGSASASTSSSSSDNDDLKCLNDPGPSRRKTRNRKGGDISSGDEVIKKYPRPEAEDIGSDDDKLFGEKQWFHKFIGEEDKFKAELSGKIFLTLEILKECESIGDKVLIFSTSLITLDIIEMFLKFINDKPITTESVADESRDISHTWVPEIDYFRMDGKCPVEVREKYMTKFNNKENVRARVMLISTKAGSLGTNLVGANRVILLDASWNPSDDVQSIFRVYRFGQVKPVYIYRFLAQGTMEEKIYNRQVTKLSMSCRVVDEQNIDRHFNASQLSELYTFEPDTREERPTLMVPKDRLLADLIITHKKWIVTYFEHDSLLQHTTEDDLTEEERQTAWTEYENEKEGLFNSNAASRNLSFIKEPIDLQTVIRSITDDASKKNPNISSIELKMVVVAQLSKLRTHLQFEHTSFLRRKQESVSLGTAVPPEVNASLDFIQLAMQHSDVFITQMKRALNAEVLQQQQQQRAQQRFNNPQQTFRPNVTGGVRFNPSNFRAPSFMGPRMFVNPKTGRFQTMGSQPNPLFRYTYTRPAAPASGSGPTIVDITDEDKDGDKESPGEAPIVTFSEESTEPKKSSASHNVKITEVE